MKVIFLDIDGVLNSHESLAMGRHLIPEKCGMIQRLCIETGAKIVISSSWRIVFDLELVKRALYFMGVNSSKIIGETPRLLDECRGMEIQKWLSEQTEVIEYCILDDESDMLEHQLPFFVKTVGSAGFTWLDYNKAFKILGAV